VEAVVHRGPVDPRRAEVSVGGVMCGGQRDQWIPENQHLFSEFFVLWFYIQIFYAQNIFYTNLYAQVYKKICFVRFCMDKFVAQIFCYEIVWTSLLSKFVVY
jgi:hypothetical protein